MFTQPNTQLVQWQDFKVRSEVDVVLEIAHQKGWKDCEIFGNGDMITQPLESMGWKLIPADLYEYSIPAEGVDRVLQTINAGVRIQGVIIADDNRRKEPPPTRQACSFNAIGRNCCVIYRYGAGRVDYGRWCHCFCTSNPGIWSFGWISKRNAGL